MFGPDWIKIGGDLDRLVDKVSDQITARIESGKLEIRNVDQDMISAKAQSLIDDDDDPVIDPAVKADLMQALAKTPGALVDLVHERLAALYPNLGYVPEDAQEQDQFKFISPDVGYMLKDAQEQDQIKITSPDVGYVYQPLYEVPQQHGSPPRPINKSEKGTNLYTLNGTAVFAGPPLDPFENKQPGLGKGQRLPPELVRAKQVHLLQTLRDQLQLLESTPNPSPTWQQQMENLRREIEVKTAEFAA